MHFLARTYLGSLILQFFVFLSKTSMFQVLQIIAVFQTYFNDNSVQFTNTLVEELVENILTETETPISVSGKVKDLQKELPDECQTQDRKGR